MAHYIKIAFLEKTDNLSHAYLGNVKRPQPNQFAAALPTTSATAVKFPLQSNCSVLSENF
jgi:hypothetical protein